MLAVESFDHVHNALSSSLASVWLEASLVLLSFPLGGLLARWLLACGSAEELWAKSLSVGASALPQAEDLHAAVRANVAFGRPAAAVAIWREVQARIPTGAETLRLVVRSLAASSPETLVIDVAGHLELHRAAICDSRSAAAALDALAGRQDAMLLDKLHQELHGRLGICMTSQAYEALLSGHAAAGNEARVAELMAEIRGARQRLTARSHALVLKGFLQSARLDAAVAQARTMLELGVYVPPFAVQRLARLAVEAGRSAELFATVLRQLELPAEAASLLLDDCVEREDAVLAVEVERHVRQTSQGVLPLNMYELLPRCADAAAASAGGPTGEGSCCSP